MRILILFAAVIALAGGLVGGTVATSSLFNDGKYLLGLAALVGIGMVLIAALTGLSRLDDRLKQKAESDRAMQADERFKALVTLARAHDFELKVKGASWLWLAMMVIAMGSAAFFMEVHWMLRLLVAVLIVPVGILLLPRAIPQLGRPVIKLTRTGFRTPTSPDIPWSLVYGVQYRETTLSSNDSESPPYGMLTFNIPTLRQEASRFSLMGRLTHGFFGKNANSEITVTLRKTSEPPSTVGRLAAYLWKQNTGRENDWEPRLSGETNAAMQQFKKANAALQEKMKSSDVDPADVEKEMAQMAASSEIIRKQFLARSKAWDRRARIDKWVLWIFIAGIVTYIVGRLMRWID